MTKYRRWYNALMDRACDRQLDGYCERHHVKPRALGGSDDKTNIVKLTYREHFLAHWLLTKTTKGNARIKMEHALWMLRKRRQIVAGWQYEVARRAQRAATKSAKYPLGKKVSAETREKMRQAHLGRKFSAEHCANIRASALCKKNLHRAQSEETREKISKTMSGRKLSTEHRKNLSGPCPNRSKALKERQFSAEHRANLSKALIGNTRGRGNRRASHDMVV